MTGRPNILLVVTDEERFALPRPQGFSLPARERIAARGTTFERYYTASAQCSSARSVIYTGRHLPSTEIYDRREQLVSAVAAEGYRELAEQLAAANPAPTTPRDLMDLAIAYVRFALDRPAMFRVMFAEPCDPANEERAAATAALSVFLHDIVATVFPDADTDPLATAVWALVHGLAFLHLDGKLDASSPEAVADQVRAAVNAALAVAPPAVRQAERR